MSKDFWSQRRAGVEAEAELETRAALAAEAKQRDAALAERSDEEILAELDLPEPEALESAEAVRTFLKSAVPQRLKTRALRRLWRLNPVLANLDGLVEYGEDYTDAATVIENIQTAYQVGKGMLARFEELAEADSGTEDVAAGAVSSEEGDTAPSEPDVEPLPEVERDTAHDVAMVSVEPEEQEPMPPAPRRMRFTFEHAT